jgi:hypothetical protein
VNNIREEVLFFSKLKNLEEETKRFVFNDSKSTIRTRKNSLNINNKEQILSIGTVASFDDVTEIIIEFYNEWKTKNWVKSSVLSFLSAKLKHMHKEIKDDNFLASQESTASDSLFTNTQDYTDKASISFKRKPKRRGKGISDLKNIL